MAKATPAKAKQGGTPASSSAGSGLLTAEVVLLGVTAFLSPLIAGRLTTIPALSLQALVLITTILHVVRRARQAAEGLSGSIVVLALTFLALLALSAIGSVSLDLTLRQFANFAAYVLIFLMVASLRPRPAVYAVLGSLLLSATLVGALGVREYVLTRSPGWRTFATFFNPDFLAGFMALMLPIALGWYLSRTSIMTSLAAGLAVLFTFANLLLAGSRFGTIAAAGGLLVFVLLGVLSRSLARPRLLRGALILAPAVAVLLLCSRPIAHRVSSVKAESHSGGFRIYVWKATLRMAGPHPINNGTGLGTFDLVYPQYSEVGYTKLAHNSYLQLAAEAGSLTAGVLLVLLGASVLPAAVRLAKGRTPVTEPEHPSWVPEDRLMLSGLLGGASASVARNLVDSDWYVTAIGITFWAVLGAALRLGRPEQPRAVQMRAGWAALAILVLAIFLAGVLVTLVSDVYAERGNSLLADGDPVAALDAFRPAARLDPLNATNLRGMASAYIMLALSFEDSSYSEQAERALKKAVSLEPTNPRNYYQLGRVYELYPRHEDAIEAFRQASERDPHSPQIMLALARRYEAAGKKKEALAVWRRMVEVEESPYERVKAMPEVVEPAYIFAHAAIGDELERLGKRNAAVREYRLAMNRIRRYQDSMKALGAVLEAAGRRDHAMESEVRSTKMRLVQRLRQLESQPAP